MKAIRYFIIGWCALFLSAFTHGQALDCKLWGEGNGTVVRLMWVPESWPRKLEGFDIKRRTVSGQQTSGWTQLNDGLIYPALGPDKDLNNVEPSRAAQQRLAAKLKDYMDTGRAGEIARENYYDEILNSENGLRNMAFAVIVDYDIALLNGFGLVDRNMPEAGRYEYGLFPKYQGQSAAQVPISTYTWKYGDKPDTKLDVSANIRTAGAKKKIRVTWAVDTDEFKKKNLKGFNIYRRRPGEEFVRVNDGVILLSVKNNPEYLVHQETLDDKEAEYRFAAAPVTIFGTEGERIEITYTAKNIPEPVAAPMLTHNAAQKQGVNLTWEFDDQLQTQVKGFVIERKAKTGDDYKPVTETLAPAARSYTDTPDSSGYFFYRLNVIRRDNTPVQGRDISIYYHHADVPEKPTGLTARWVEANGAGYVALTWSSRNDPGMKGYRLFVSKPGSNLLVYDATIPLISGTGYRYEISEYRRGAWQFAVAAVSHTGDESEMSDMVRILTPSKKLPGVFNRYVEQAGDRAIVRWDYPDDIADLAGFRLYENGRLVADESALGRDAKSWSSASLETGRRYSYEIMAVSQFNVESRKTTVQIKIQ